MLRFPDAMALEFSPWKYWENRNDLTINSTKEFPLVGIYALAFSNGIKDGATLTWTDVQYIGMTTRALQARWNQLDRALDSRGGHILGDRLSAGVGCKRRSDGGWNVGGARLLVSAIAIPIGAAEGEADRLRRFGQVAYLEFEALAQYFTRMNRVPPYNVSARPRQTKRGLAMVVT